MVWETNVQIFQRFQGGGLVLIVNQIQQRLVFQLIRLLPRKQEPPKKLLRLLIFKFADDLKNCLADRIVAYAEAPDQQR